MKSYPVVEIPYSDKGEQKIMHFEVSMEDDYISIYEYTSRPHAFIWAIQQKIGAINNNAIFLQIQPVVPDGSEWLTLTHRGKEVTLGPGRYNTKAICWTEQITPGLAKQFREWFDKHLMTVLPPLIEPVKATCISRMIEYAQARMNVYATDITKAKNDLGTFSHLILDEEKV